MRVFLRDILTTLIMAVVIFSGLQFTVQSSIIHESSMQPSFYEGQRILVNKVVYRLHEPERGDVVILHPPAPYSPNSNPFIKRIIGLPGESVEIKEGIVYIYKEDGSILVLDEPYVSQAAKHPFQVKKIPQNEYLVLGDNRNNSGDSRQGWTVPRQNIIGKAWLSTWPPSRWGLVASYSYKGE